MVGSRVRAAGLLLAGVLVLAACGSGDGDGATGGDDTTSSDARIGMVFDIGGRGDLSFNDASAAGLDRLTDETGLDFEFLEPEGGGENREELLRLLAEDRYDLVFAVGFLFLDAVAAAAADFPDVTFALIGTSVEAPNVASLIFAEEEGSFLAGVVAAETSETGVIGYIGGVEEPSTQVFQAGFEAGARHVDPDIEITSRYLTQPPDFSGFNDPARANELARGMYGAGADVIYHASGGSGQGVFEAARQHTERSGEHVWVIGVDSDQYLTVDEELRPYVLSSMVKRLDNAVYDTAREVLDGTFEPGTRRFDLAADGMEMATSGGFVDHLADRLTEVRTAIESGEIQVPRIPQ